MVEFGGRLSLKDNMYATLQKNLKMQRQFTEQVKQTSSNIKSLAKAKVQPVIRAKDKATTTVKKVKNGLKTVAKTIAKPFITVKDKATSAVNKVKNGLKAVGKFIAKPFVAIKDRASPIVTKIKNKLTQIGKTVAKPFIAIKDGATKVLSKIKGTLGTLSKGVKIAVGIAGAGATALMAGSLNEGAKLQQSKGGVETLFKDNAGDVMKNANIAYETAGLSANAYMETVTSFSASLISSLGGDTAKASEVANTAIIDMADNANKFGTDMESIQNAYQGFAKQNYTMLDNLKLGYGGTKEEMQRLLNDAQKLTGQKYDIKNLSDVYNAIHAVQENLGVTGTTADEASRTFTGSFSAMKASAQNFLGALSTGGDIEGTMSAMVESASTFLFGNLVPMVGSVIKALPSAIRTGIANASPIIKEEGGKILTSLKEGMEKVLPSSVMDTFSAIGLTIQNVVTHVAPVIDTFKNIFVQAMPIVQNIIQGVCGFINAIMPTVSSIFQFVGNVIQKVLGLIGNHMGLFRGIVSTVVTVVISVWRTLSPAIGAVIDTVITVVDGLLTGIETVFNFLAPYVSQIWADICGFFESSSSTIGTVCETLQTVFQTLYDFISSIFSSISDTVSSVMESVTGWISGAVDSISGFIDTIGGAISKAGEFMSTGIGKVAGVFGFAYGKDRVPYDNYPAVLHQGEKVLTRNQADQYERAMSSGTRGVQLGSSISEAPRASISSAGTSVSIDKLADTVVINKEADVDKVVEDMINKFRKLVPNMA